VSDGSSSAEPTSTPLTRSHRNERVSLVEELVDALPPMRIWGSDDSIFLEQDVELLGTSLSRYVDLEHEATSSVAVSCSVALDVGAVGHVTRFINV
jgi:hypothetical protein